MSTSRPAGAARVRALSIKRAQHAVERSELARRRSDAAFDRADAQRWERVLRGRRTEASPALDTATEQALWRLLFRGTALPGSSA